MSRHHVLTHLAKHFHVIWMNPAYERKELKGRLGRPAFREPLDRSSFLLYDPEVWLPNLYKPAALSRTLDRIRLGRARSALEERGCSRIILYLWRPRFAEAVQRVDHDLLCYHIDDEYTFSDEDLPTPPVEVELIQKADQVFVHTQALLEKKGGLNPSSSLVPLGVNFDAFADPQPIPDDLGEIPQPRIGYTGHLKKHLDWTLLVRLAERNPSWSWVFIGGREAHPEIDRHIALMQRLENVHFLGSKPWSRMGAYVQHLDVGVMPYALTPYTEYVSPLKLQEYLAAGLPSVGVPIRALRENESVVLLAQGVQEWEEQLRRALSPEARLPEAIEQRQAHARQYRWDDLVGKIAGRLFEHLDENGKGMQP